MPSLREWLKGQRFLLKKRENQSIRMTRQSIAKNAAIRYQKVEERLLPSRPHHLQSYQLFLQMGSLGTRAESQTTSETTGD